MTGSPKVCKGQSSVIYTVPTIANATSYLWTLPSGATGSSTTNSITVRYGLSAVAGNITVKGSSLCGYGAATTLAITVNPLPANAGTIRGSTTVYQGEISVAYMVSAITNATSYFWTLPEGATGTSTSNSIIVNYGASAISGNISVRGSNLCGGGLAAYLPIKVNPGNSEHITGITTVCQGQNMVTYTFDPWYVASSYIWTLPVGATGYSTTKTITVNYGKSAISSNIKVSGYRYPSGQPIPAQPIAVLAVTVNPLPSLAGKISGIASVYQGQNSVNYEVAPITNATSYLWTLPSGATGSSTTNSITVNYGLSAVSGSITVKGNNSCGSGSISTLTVSVRANKSGYLPASLIESDSIKTILANSKDSQLKSDIGLTTDNEDVTVYPNPTKGRVYLKFTNISKIGTWITLFDLSGKVISKSLAKNLEESINLDGYPAGLYFIMINQNPPKTFKIILE